MSKKTYAAILDDIAREHVSDHVDLAPRILAQIQKKKGISMRPRVKIFMAAIVVLLVLAFLLVRVPAAADAMQRMLSRFIPGIGMVDVSTTRVLAEPVSVTRDGVTVTVEQLVADSQHTVVVYKVEGLPEPIQSPPGDNDCIESPRLRLPNGTELLYPRGESSSGVSTWGVVEFSATYEYFSVQAEVSNLTFVLPCVERMDRGTLPENWEIPLALVPAPPDITTYPVIEVVLTPISSPSTPTPQNVSSTPALAPAASRAHNVSIAVDRVVPLEDSFRLYVRLKGKDGLRLDNASLHLLDVTGRQIPGWLDIAEQAFNDDGSLSLAFEASEAYTSAPVTVVVDEVGVSINAEANGMSPSFNIDVGQHPQIDQVWELYHDFLIGNYPLHIATARFFERSGEYGFDFQMISSNPAVHSAWLFDMDVPRGRYGGAFMGYNGEPFHMELTYQAGFVPSGTVTITISAISVTLEGPWQATVTLPTAEETPDP